MTQIIIKKKIKSFYPDLPAGIVMGDVRGAMANSTLGMCESIIDKYYGKKEVIYILIHSNPDPAARKIIRTKIMILDQEPPRMLGAVCFLVDYRISDVDLLWALPLDTLRPPETISDERADRILDDAKGLPILN